MSGFGAGAAAGDSWLSTTVSSPITHNRNPIDRANPRGVGAAHHGARDRRIDITISQDYEARAQRRQHFLFQTVGEISCVVELQSQTAQSVSRAGVLDPAAGEH